MATDLSECKISWISIASEGDECIGAVRRGPSMVMGSKDSKYGSTDPGDIGRRDRDGEPYLSLISAYQLRRGICTNLRISDKLDRWVLTYTLYRCNPSAKS